MNVYYLTLYLQYCKKGKDEWPKDDSILARWEQAIIHQFSFEAEDYLTKHNSRYFVCWQVCKQCLPAHYSTHHKRTKKTREEARKETFSAMIYRNDVLLSLAMFPELYLCMQATTRIWSFMFK